MRAASFRDYTFLRVPPCPHVGPKTMGALDSKLVKGPEGSREQLSQQSPQNINWSKVHMAAYVNEIGPE